MIILSAFIPAAPFVPFAVRLPSSTVILLAVIAAVPAPDTSRSPPVTFNFSVLTAESVLFDTVSLPDTTYIVSADTFPSTLSDPTVNEPSRTPSWLRTVKEVDEPPSFGNTKIPSVIVFSPDNSIVRSFSAVNFLKFAGPILIVTSFFATIEIPSPTPIMVYSLSSKSVRVLVTASYSIVPLWASTYFPAFSVVSSESATVYLSTLER